MLKVRLSKSPPALILELIEQFDSLSIEGINTLIVGSQEWGCKHIVFDLSDITWIDPVVVGQLFVWYHKMRPHQVKLSILNPRPHIQKIFEETNFSEIIPIEFSDSSAVHQNGTTA